ncbi:MAG TPA: response regulator, partial [Blastocatellia bacterium]|nr:response regulator [Blastocatellia bacterium]
MSTHILIAEDNADLRDVLQELLEDEGYTVTTAPDGREAMMYIERDDQMIDLIITDVQMPGIKGDQLLAAVREKRGETPVIVITAFGSVEQAVEMVKAGAYQYLTKPIANRDLLAAVSEAMVSSAPQREQARLRRESMTPPERIIGASRPMQ